MRAVLMMAGLTAGTLLCGFAGQDAGDRSFTYNSTGRQNPWFYNNVHGDCESVVHGFGRNSAWGLWTVPLAATSHGAVISGPGGFEVTFDCLDGSTCITAERVRDWNAAPQLSSHAVPFETREMAEDFAARVAALRAACAA